MVSDERETRKLYDSLSHSYKKKRFHTYFLKRNLLTYERHSLQQETSGIVYTTVDFRARQETAKVHKDAKMQEAQTQKGNCSDEHDGIVEYSALACHQWGQDGF